ncbi:MAG: glutamate--tRNA ligase [Deltaproteobacteria bacterium]|nr:glutamate--tRNA ligase [Deltaproteobacteria bacterium]
MSVRVRIAPSPTGDPHVGTAYIALFNYVFARQNNGKFILRIEDTDRERSTKESEGAIFRALRWAGIEWDEGPDIGGKYAPYRQSERVEIYRKHAAELLERGAAYYCFCTPQRLDELREEQKRNKLPPGYDGKCLNLKPDEINEQIANGVPRVIRLKMPDEGETVVKDRLRGEIRYQNSLIDFQVLVKSDGFPTYHLANVVDDHLMEITHVIRAEEWINSTPKHLALYEAFGWRPPEFIHMPLLRNKDKSKISKRKNPVSLDFYRSIGILPEALLNFLALMGWSMPDEREEFSLAEMVNEFTFDRISLGGPVFDLEKLFWLNGLYIRKLDNPELLKRLKSELFNDDMMLKIIPLVRERMRALGEFPDATSFYFGSEVAFQVEDVLKAAKGRTAAAVAADLKKYLEEFDDVKCWELKEIEEHLRSFCERNGLKTGDFFMVLRIILTGRRTSPPLIESMEVLGRTMAVQRIRKGIEILARK